MTDTVNPVLPFIKVTSDATQQVVNNANQITANLVYFRVAVDSANRIFVQVPNTAVNGLTQYKWFVLDNTATNYPVGNIQDINCSFTYSNFDCIIQLIVLTDSGIYAFNGTTSQAGTGLTTYVWSIQQPSGDVPVLPNPY
jgi:hypothetical protein